jgi:signal transduction histidine kinase
MRANALVGNPTFGGCATQSMYLRRVDRHSGGVATDDPSLMNSPVAHIGALEVLVDVLSHGEEGAAGDEFYGRLCEAVCRLTSMDRAVIFRYDEGQRRVRAVGAYGMDLAPFDDIEVTVDTAPVARRALTEDRVFVVSDADVDVPPELEHLLDDALLVCTPMMAAGRWVGVILSERGEDGAPVSEAERSLLWTIGKAAALAATARTATRQSEKARQLQGRIDLAREIHDRVVQRLFGVSLALSSDVGLSDEERRRCADEVHQALADLRTAVQRPLGRTSRETQTTLAQELARLQRAHADLNVVVVSGDPSSVPAALEPLAQSVLIEAVRNARKHARPTRVRVSLARDDGAFVLEVVNDGAVQSASPGWGMGLRLAALEALQLGGIVEFGPRPGGQWEVRLVVEGERD